MILLKIGLKDFRNRKKDNFTFHPQLTVIMGENARGKTNLLESIHLMTQGVGFRESKEEELIMWNRDETLVDCEFLDVDNSLFFQVYLTRLPSRTSKEYYVNKTKKSHKSYLENQTRSVLFEPGHIEIVTGSPDKRRQYINSILSSLDPLYKKHLHNYEQALRKRNKILEHHTNDRTLLDDLSFWDTYLEEQASYLTEARHKYVEYLNKNQEVKAKKFQIRYVKNILTAKLLNEKLSLEKIIRRTTIGPQKDDFEISMMKDKTKENVHLYGSRSEKRLAVFWLKLNEIKYIKDILHKNPILLLDDVTSELDQVNKHLVFSLIKEYQSVVTTTEGEIEDFLDSSHLVIRI